MADANFNMKAQLCAVCKNQLKQPFDNEHPERPLMSCRVLKMIPIELLMATSYTCKHFDFDEEKYKIYKDLLPQNFNP
jgi:hypothetical protein